MPGPDGLRVPDREVDQLGVVAAPPDEAGTRRLAERQPEPQPRRGLRERLVEVLHGLDEVGVAEDEVLVLGLVDPDGRELHANLLRVRWPGPPGRAAPALLAV